MKNEKKKEENIARRKTLTQVKKITTTNVGC